LAILIRNIETNIIEFVPDHYLDHPVLGVGIIAVEQESAPVSTKKQSKVVEPVADETTNEQE
jgi:hypothetical protein